MRCISTCRTNVCSKLTSNLRILLSEYKDVHESFWSVFPLAVCRCSTLLALGDYNSECENMATSLACERRFTTGGHPRDGIPEGDPWEINYMSLSHRIKAKQYLQSHHIRQVMETLEANI